MERERQNLSIPVCAALEFGWWIVVKLSLSFILRPANESLTQNLFKSGLIIFGSKPTSETPLLRIVSRAGLDTL